MNDTLIQIFGTLGMNGLLWGIRKVVPKIPAVVAPILNVGLTTAVAVYAPWLLTPMDAAVISGGSTILHNVVKNAARGDALGERPASRAGDTVGTTFPK